MCQEIDKMNLSIFLSIFYVSLLTFNVIKYYTESGCFCICTQFLRCKNASNAYDIQEYIYNIQTKLLVIKRSRRSKFLLGHHFLNPIHRNVSLRKHRHQSNSYTQTEIYLWKHTIILERGKFRRYTYDIKSSGIQAGRKKETATRERSLWIWETR